MADDSTQLSAFMNAIKTIESSGRYSVIGPHTKYGTPRGAYQILDSNWASWAAQAGIAGADWRDPAAQDRVAAYKMNEYFARYGSWDLVAVAWFAGPGRAAEAARKGIDSVSNLADLFGTSVEGYVRKMRNAWDDSFVIDDLVYRPDGANASAFQHPLQNPNKRPTLQQVLAGSAGGPQVGSSSRQFLTAFFDNVSRGVAGGQRILPPVVGKGPGLPDPVPQPFDNPDATPTDSSPVDEVPDWARNIEEGTA